MEGTTFSLHSAARPEAMADVPGVCELPLTRAVVHYRDLHEVDPPGGRIQDIGLAVVLEGRFCRVDTLAGNHKRLSIAGWFMTEHEGR